MVSNTKEEYFWIEKVLFNIQVLSSKQFSKGQKICIYYYNTSTCFIPRNNSKPCDHCYTCKGCIVHIVASYVVMKLISNKIAYIGSINELSPNKKKFPVLEQ